MVRPEKSATGWPGTSIPTASIRTIPLTRGDCRSALVYTATPGTESHEKLQLLTVIGHQNVSV